MLLSPREKRPVVLIVEDDHALRELYRVAVMSAGYTVVAVEDGIDALRYIEGCTPNLVVLDLDLPRLSGTDVRRELASHPETHTIPIIVVTGTADARGLRPSDVSGLLKKPVATERLLEEIDRALSTAHRLSSAASSDGTHFDRSIRTVLVVDDDAGIRSFLTLFLGEKGYSVKTADSVGEAVVALAHSVIDAVILDVRMPTRSGLALLELIRLGRTRRDFPVLILTGAPLTENEKAVIARHHAYLFHKSGNLDSLVARLQQQLTH